MKRSSVIALATALALSACGDQSAIPTSPEPSFSRGNGGSQVVTTNADAGPGSLRSAIEQANADPSVRRIRFDRNVGQIDLQSTLTYAGSQDLVIEARGAVIDGSAIGDVLVATGGASLSLRDLVVQNAGADGIVVQVPAAATGVVSLEMAGVILVGNGEFGAHLDDQSSGSAASLRLLLDRVTVANNGFALGIDDKDGIRVDEGGEGDIVFHFTRVIVTGNAADGIELDEKGTGDVRGVIQHSTFDDNGTQPQLPSDLEDGFDIDEADDGSIVVEMVDVSASRNSDGGIDLDEEGAGDIIMQFTRVVAVDNAEENIKASEDANVEDTADPDDGNGGVEFFFVNVRSTGSGDNGIQFEEFGNGDVNGTFVQVRSNDNADDGVNIDQTDNGGGTVRLIASEFTGNADKNINIKGVTVVQHP
jgi:hypothetical protein